MPDLLLGIDCSITAAKAMAWDGSGKVRAEGRASLEEIRPRPGYSEQRAEDWWQATANAVAELMRTVPGDRITGICITHQRESFVPVDDHNRPLRNAILWDDARSQVRLDQLGDQLGHDELHRRTGRGRRSKRRSPSCCGCWSTSRRSWQGPTSAWTCTAFLSSGSPGTIH
jgi:xylulokinase